MSKNTVVQIVFRGELENAAEIVAKVLRAAEADEALDNHEVESVQGLPFNPEFGKPCIYFP
jgi:hypothetical protein